MPIILLRARPADAPPPSFEGPLDAYATGLVAAYSLRRLLASHPDQLTTVRRSSDSAEDEIGSSEAGALDEAALAAHVGASDGRVRVWHRQAGAVDAVQATSGTQPWLVTGGAIERIGPAPALRFAGNQRLETTGVQLGNTRLFAGPSDAFTVFVVAEGAGTTAMLSKSTNSGSGNTFLLLSAGSEVRVRLRGTETTVNAAHGGEAHLYTIRWDGAVATGWLDGGPAMTLGVGSGSDNNAQLTIGARGTGGTYGLGLVGRVGEVLVYDRALGTVEREAVRDILMSYFGL